MALTRLDTFVRLTGKKPRASCRSSFGAASSWKGEAALPVIPVRTSTERFAQSADRRSHDHRSRRDESLAAGLSLAVCGADFCGVLRSAGATAFGGAVGFVGGHDRGGVSELGGESRNDVGLRARSSGGVRVSPRGAAADVAIGCRLIAGAAGRAPR